MRKRKRCRTCKKYSYLDMFNTNVRNGDGLDSRCRRCNSEGTAASKRRSLEMERERVQGLRKRRADIITELALGVPEAPPPPTITAYTPQQRRLLHRAEALRLTAPLVDALLIRFGARDLCGLPDDACENARAYLRC